MNRAVYFALRQCSAAAAVGGFSFLLLLFYRHHEAAKRVFHIMQVGARFGKRRQGGEDLLVAGHGGIEDNFAAATAGGSDDASAKYTVVGEGENSVELHNQQLQSA